MKVYLLYTDNGLSYDDYGSWVKEVLSVPDTFEPEEDSLSFYHRLKERHPDWFRKDGRLKANHTKQAVVLYEGDLLARFQPIPFVPRPWQSDL